MGGRGGGVDEGDVADGEDVDGSSGDIDIDLFVSLAFTTDGGSGSSASRGSSDDSINPSITWDKSGPVDAADADAAELDEDWYWTWNVWDSWKTFWSDEDMADGEGVDFFDGGDDSAAAAGGESWQDNDDYDDYYPDSDSNYDADLDWGMADGEGVGIDEDSVTAGLADTTDIDRQDPQRLGSVEADSSGVGGPGLSESAAQARGDNFPWTGCTDVGVGCRFLRTFCN